MTRTRPCAAAAFITCLPCHLCLQDLFLVLAELPRFLAATHASTLQEQDTAQVCQALLAALPAEGTLPQPLLNSPGIKTWYSTLRRAQPQLSAAQQLQVLECLAAMVRAGCGELMEDDGALGFGMIQTWYVWAPAGAAARN